VKITIIFPARDREATRATVSGMPPSLTLLAALTSDRHQVTLVDMFMGDSVDYEREVDLVAITVRTPLAVSAYEIADRFLERGKKVVLGGPHTFALPEEARSHASAVAIGEGEPLWPVILEDAEREKLQDFYVCGRYPVERLRGTVYHEKERPSLEDLPVMRRDLLPRDRYFMDSIFTTRGCPNHCNFCPVTSLFGSKIRHRPVDEVVAEVETLGRRYFNVDDSVFGHPQRKDMPEENQYYLDLYRELAGLRPRRVWAGAGGLSAVNYRDGRKILELAAESGLSMVAAGLESISCEGQKESGAWRKLHYSSPDSFELDKMKENVRAIQDMGIAIMGFFVIGWDEDTVETYYRTLDFCDECNLIPFIFTLTPMPGSSIYQEYLAKGRVYQDRPWSEYGGGGESVVFEHPLMSESEMLAANSEVLWRGYSLGRVLKRTVHAITHGCSTEVAKNAFFMQLGLRKEYRQLYDQVQARP
jgi:radical SAM superfamily enzyme YgiQ (UPF0313 family)